MTEISIIQSRTLPVGWRWERLSDILTDIDNGSRPRGGVAGITEGILSIGAEHISERGGLYLTNPRYISKDFFSRMSRGIVKPCDILLVKDGATTGRVAFVEKVDEPGFAINEHIFILRPNNDIVNPAFLFYVLFSPSGKKAILNSFHGAAQGGITQDFAKVVWIPLPPTLHEQERIATEIKSEIEIAQRLYQVTEKQLRASAALSQNIINQEMIKAGNPNGHLINILRSPPQSGWPHAYGNEPEGVPFLTLTAVLNFKYDGTQVKFTDQLADENGDYWAHPGDIFMSRSNTPELVGQAAIYDGTPARVVFPDLLIRLQPDTSRADIRFVHYWLMSRAARLYITSNARGSSGTMKKITLEMVEEVPFPSHLGREQQEHIANDIDQRVIVATKVLDAAERQAEAANALKNSLLKETFGGLNPPIED